MIALLFMASAMLRLALPLGDALVNPAQAQQEAQQDTAGEPATRTGPFEEAQALMDALAEREAKIEEDERQIRLRRQALRVADAQIEKRLAELEEAEESLRSLIAVADTAAEEDLSQLTEVYSNMKSKDAALLFETMDPKFAAGFLGRMRAEAAAEIMSDLSPEAAYTISVILAGRNANAPKD